MARDERRLTIVHRVLAVVLVAAAGALVTTRSEAAVPEDALASDGAAVSARDPLLVLGDSLCANSFVETVDIAGVLREVGWEPELVCWPGAPIGFGIDVVRERRTVPAAVVVALGTNGGIREAGFANRLAELRALLRARGAAQFVWVNYADAPQRYGVKNGELAMFTAAHGDRLVDWASLIGENPQWFRDDGLHYTDEGLRQWVRAIATAVAAEHEPSRRLAALVARAYGSSFAMPWTPAARWAARRPAF